MTNQSQFPYEVCIGQRIAQIIFPKIEKGTFTKAGELTKTERQFGGFGSIGCYILNVCFSTSKNVFCRS